MVEITLKAAVASRTLDNITAVIVCFKNFKKVNKNRLTQGQASIDNLEEADFSPEVINQKLKLPNLDIIESDVERPENIGQPDLEQAASNRKIENHTNKKISEVNLLKQIEQEQIEGTHRQKPPSQSETSSRFSQRPISQSPKAAKQFQFNGKAVNPVQVPTIKKVEHRQLGELKRQKEDNYLSTPLNEASAPMGIGTSGAPPIAHKFV